MPAAAAVAAAGACRPTRRGSAAGPTLRPSARTRRRSRRGWTAAARRAPGARGGAGAPRPRPASRRPRAWRAARCRAGRAGAPSPASRDRRGCPSHTRGIRNGGSGSGQVERGARPSCRARHRAGVAAGSLGSAPAGSAATIAAGVAFSQPCRALFVQRAAGRTRPRPVAGWHKAGLLRPPRAGTHAAAASRAGPAACGRRPPPGWGMAWEGPASSSHRTRPPAPRPGVEPAGPLDQLFLAAASPSLTATGPPRSPSPLRLTTPGEHRVRRRCQLRPAAWSACQMVEGLIPPTG